MKFAAISDTHGIHNYLELPEADVLIHAGDVSNRGRKHEVEEFLTWFGELNYTYKIFIAGNHDFYFENESEETIKKMIPESVIYLNDSGIEINEINIWGSPVSPWFYDWAFNRKRGNEIQKHWDLIPQKTAILVTHGPAFGILDKVKSGEKVGCENLLQSIQTIKPVYHICGHIHEAYGKHQIGETTFINASVLNENYILQNAPIIFEL